MVFIPTKSTHLKKKAIEAEVNLKDRNCLCVKTRVLKQFYICRFYKENLKYLELPMARNFVNDAITYISCTDCNELLQAALKI